ncbi:uncharacterized protein H6S33_008546 [Morchella sextelata]|uniref:uncharacterized protein n=1 Tax=Morchella sextelata TaxID=1174677 RepID=UPI001D05A70D|nr:uncharacterized protein H6S33_008546 [Morchella sextelata]KAH0602896.1 hypothetical protein H6S33_008546 [Morchella sextelata]
MGSMTIVCESCSALHWIDERIAASSKIKPRFEICCKKGDIQLLPLQAPPPYLQYLLQSPDPVARRFRTSIREYNSALTFTSVKYTADQRAPAQSGGLQCFQIHGELYHIQGPCISKLCYSSGRSAYALGARHARRRQGRVLAPGVATAGCSRQASPQQGARARRRHSRVLAPGVATAGCSRQASPQQGARARRRHSRVLAPGDPSIRARRPQSSMFSVWQHQGA